ncbi:conserved protein of unknown function [Modestobacter italicus]|uniref:Golgi phosphoprotein 3 n=1 Tax=Modestobacter italicus (strain DSM 44449 / CECT 9708 / BC 501) TaxID=2732864 RepID=I4EX67_MODI5|nr:conserved protein of unknown function [Modestobacter marinus]
MLVVDWTESVAMRLAGLALDPRGRLTDDLVTPIAVRGAIAVEMVLRDRLTDVADSVELDASPTHFAPADRWVTDWVGAGGTLRDALVRPGVDQYDLRDEHLRLGSWTERPRRWVGRQPYVDHRSERTARDEELPQRVASLRDPRDAALLCIAWPLGLLGMPRTFPEDEQLATTGPARWVVELTVDLVHRARIGWFLGAADTVGPG